MKKVKTEDAVGMTLCHDVTAMRDGFKGPAFRRGHVIQKEDIPVLFDLGKRHIYVWEEHAGEIHEEDAALRLSALAPVEGAHYTAPSEGKVLLKADMRGMFRVNVPLLEKINAIGDITISTLPDHYPVEIGSRLASMRIVPLVTQESQIEAAEALSAGEKLLDLRPYRQQKVGVVITGSEIYSGRIQDKFEPVIRKKLAAYPAEILGIRICDDDTDMITAAAEAFLEQGASLIFFSGGMSVDPDDLTPAAITALGGERIRYGVPSQPGNMTLLAYRGKTAFVGVPGAAIIMPTTILDVLLPQLFTGDPIRKEDLNRLGDGGLCQLCLACHFPNCSFGRY